MRANVAELVEAEFGIVVAVSLERFKSNGWFAVGLTEAECPRCRSRMQGYRMPYTTKAGLTYHYWALACLECKHLFEPANLDEASRQLLYKSSGHRPEPAGESGDSRPQAKFGARSGSRQCSPATQEIAGAGKSHGLREEIKKLKEDLERKLTNKPDKHTEAPVENTAKQRSEEGSGAHKWGDGKKDEVPPAIAARSNIPPSRKLAERIVARLVSERLLTEQHGKQLLPKLAEGKIQPDDWRLPIELSDSEED